MISLRSNPTVKEDAFEIIKRSGMAAAEGMAEAKPDDELKELVQSWGAHFC